MLRFVNVLLLFFLIIFKYLNAQEDKLFPTYYPIFSHTYGLPENFPDRCVQSTHLDPAGRLWIQPCYSTQYDYFIHLFQFDGTIVKSLNWDITSPYRSTICGMLPNGDLFGYLEDEGTWTWIAFHFDINQKQLKKYSCSEASSDSCVISSVFLGADNKILIGYNTRDEIILNRIEGDQQIEVWRLSKKGLGIGKNLKENKVHFLAEVKEGYWIVEQMGFPILLDSNGKVLKRMFIKSTEEELLQRGREDYFRRPKILKGNKFQKWLFYLPWTKSNVFEFGVQKEELVPFSILPGNWQFPPLDSRYWDIVYEDNAGNVLLEVLDERKKKRFLLLDSNLEIFDYSPVVAIQPKLRSLVSEDFRNFVFIGSPRGLITSGVKKEEKIQTFPTRNTRAIFQLSKDEFLIQRAGDYQLLVANTQNGTLKPFFKSGYDENFQIHHDKMRILREGDTHLWLSYSNKLFRCDTEGINCNTVDLEILIHKQAWLNEKEMVLVDEENQLYFYNIETQKLTPYLENGKQPAFPKGCHDLLLSKKDILWLATSLGLWKIDYKNQQSQLFDIKNGFSDFRFLCIQEDGSGKLWLGTFAGGVQIFDPETEKVQIVDATSGLSQNTVVTLLQDDEGMFWVATQNGLTLLKKDGERITEFYAKDGLTNSEFNRYSSCKATDGRLVFGTIDGANVINPSALKAPLNYQFKPKIFLSSLSYFSKEIQKEVKKESGLDQLAPLILPAGSRFLRLNFALSNYLEPEKNQYAYQISGVNDEWIWIGNQTHLSLQNLPVGQYDILLKAKDHRGLESSNVLRIPVVGKAFFYQQWWFYLLLFTVLLAIAAIWILSLRRVNLSLESEVQKRTQRIVDDKKIIEQQAAELRELDQVKSRFFANISHELRTPLTLIIGPIRSLLKKGNLQKEELRLAKLIETHSLALNQRVNQILDLTKLDSKKLDLLEKPTNVSAISRRIVALFESNAVQKGIDLKFEQENDQEFKTLIDPQKLETILENFLSNALKFTPRGGNIRMFLEAKNEFLEWRVQDSGKGIPSNEVDNVFDRYYQVQHNSDGSGGGTGIGLALCKELVELMGGQIWVSSELGQGSSFFVSLPFRPITYAPAVEESFSEVIIPIIQSKPKNPQGRILLVEDNADLREYVIGLLPDYQIISAEHGQEALQKLENEKIDLMISDVMMPVMDGFELLKNLKEHPHYQSIPVVMLTARAALEDKLEALRIGVDDYILKPFAEEELLARVANALKRLQNRSTQEEATEEEIIHPQQKWLQELEVIVLHELTNSQFNLEWLAEKLLLSKRQLQRRMKSYTGMTASEYIREIRLHQARQLLESGNYQTVGEVCYAVGFENQSHFSNIYLERFGKKPSEYLY